MIRRAEKPPNRLALMGKIAVRNLSFARERRKNHVHWAYPEDRGARGEPCAADQTPRFGTDRFGAGHFHQQWQTAVAGESDNRIDGRSGNVFSHAHCLLQPQTHDAVCPERDHKQATLNGFFSHSAPNQSDDPITHFVLLVQSESSFRESSGLCTEADRTRAGPADNTQGQGYRSSESTPH